MNYRSTFRSVVLVLGVVSLSALAAGRSPEAIRKAGALRVAVDGQTPGFNFYKGTELAGFEVDLAKEIAKRLGVKVEWTVKPFNTLLVALGQDRFDLIATSHAITPERKKVADFTAPHYCTGAQIITTKNGPKTLAALTGKTVAVPVGTTYYDFLKKVSGLKKLKTLPSENEGMQELLSGRTDAWVTEQFVGLAAVKARPELVAGDVLFSQDNAMVVAKGNDKLRDAVNQQLTAILADGTYERLSKQWFERDIRCH